MSIRVQTNAPSALARAAFAAAAAAALQPCLADSVAIAPAAGPARPRIASQDLPAPFTQISPARAGTLAAVSPAAPPAINIPADITLEASSDLPVLPPLTPRIHGLVGAPQERVEVPIDPSAGAGDAAAAPVVVPLPPAALVGGACLLGVFGLQRLRRSRR